MYRIELKPGEETALRTVEELAIGIRNGVITSRARIWHNAGQKWLPIEFHPHYQAALKHLEDHSPATTAPAAPAVDEPAMPALPVARRRRSATRPVGWLVGGIVLLVGARMALSASPSTAEPEDVASPPVAAPRPILAPDKPAASTPPPPAASMPAALSKAVPRVPGGAVVRGPSQVAPPPVDEPAVEIAPAPTALDLSVPSMTPDLSGPITAEADSGRGAIQAILKAAVQP